MNETAKREGYLDIAKGIGIILVILGHIDIGFATSWLYSFDLPLFYLVAGICFRYRENLGEYLIKRARRCLIPYAVFGVLIVLVESRTGYLYETGLKTNFLRLLIQERYSTLWFLATLFLASIIFYLIVKLCQQNPIRVLVVSLLLSVVFVVLDQEYIRALPWNLDTAFIVLGFMALGYFIKQKEILDKLLGLDGKKRAFTCIFLFVLNAVFYVANTLVSGTSLEMYWNSYGMYPLMYLAAVTGSLFVIIISNAIACKPLETLGRNSMTYFALHQSVVMWPVTLFFRKIHLITFKGGWNNILAKVLTFIIIMCVCAIIDKVIRNTKLKFILGE